MLLLEQEERLLAVVVVHPEREVSHGQVQGEERGQDLDTRTRTLKASHIGGTSLSYRRCPGLQNHTEHLSSSMLVCSSRPAEAIEEREGAHSASHRGRKMSRESRENSDQIDADPSPPLRTAPQDNGKADKGVLGIGAESSMELGRAVAVM